MLVEGYALTTVMLFIGIRSTELLWKLINLVNSFPCSEEDVLDGISGFYLQKKSQKPWHFKEFPGSLCTAL